jgi:hypothetical protein
MLRQKTKSNKRKYKATGSARYADKYMSYRTKKRSASGYMSKSRRVGTGASGVSAPVQTGVKVSGGMQSSFTQRQMSGGGLRITGRSFVTSVDSKGKYSNGLLAIVDCNPILLNDRVAAIATTYEKYVYQSLTYRFVPQCPTSTAGSVMLTFERDPANPAANGGDPTSFMQNCMSYEHTSITPPWVGSSVTYKRDANEKKLFWISGQGSNYDPRGTSQGQFLCYGANVPTETGLGFIVMDYVLDLCEPSIMPARTGAGIAGNGTASTNLPSQYQFMNTNAVTKYTGIGSSSVMNRWTGSIPLVGADADCILELILEGSGVPDGGNSRFSPSEFNAKATPPVPRVFGRGSHLYLVLRRWRNGILGVAPAGQQSNLDACIVCRNLADAIAALAAPSDTNSVTGDFLFPNALYALKDLADSSDLDIGGFWRQLTLKASDDFQV